MEIQIPVYETFEEFANRFIIFPQCRIPFKHHNKMLTPITIYHVRRKTHASFMKTLLRASNMTLHKIVNVRSLEQETRGIEYSERAASEDWRNWGFKFYIPEKR